MFQAVVTPRRFSAEGILTWPSWTSRKNPDDAELVDIDHEKGDLFPEGDDGKPAAEVMDTSGLDDTFAPVGNSAGGEYVGDLRFGGFEDEFEDDDEWDDEDFDSADGAAADASESDSDAASPEDSANG